MCEVMKLCDEVRELAYAIHVYHGNGYLEKVYENALAHRLRKAKFRVKQQHAMCKLIWTVAHVLPQEIFDARQSGGDHSGFYVALDEHDVVRVLAVAFSLRDVWNATVPRLWAVWPCKISPLLSRRSRVAALFFPVFIKEIFQSLLGAWSGFCRFFSSGFSPRPSFE